MSFKPAFQALFDSQSGERLSVGCYALMSVVNLEWVEARRIPGDHDAHVLADQSARVSRMVGLALTNDCPPPVENSEPRSVTVPGKDGQGVVIPSGQPPKPSRKPTLSLSVKKTASSDFDLFPDSLPASKSRKTSVLVPALDALSPSRVVGSDGPYFPSVGAA